jgi:ketosteroid isomerase-like protein
MSKQFSATLWFSLAVSIVLVQPGYSKSNSIARNTPNYCGKIMQASDSATARAEVMNVINAVIKASGTFDISAVANLYTPNAVIADEEPPFSWNGPTAGVQWVSVVEKTCKDYKLRDFKGKIGRINVYLQTDESIYVVVPVNYTGQIRGENFEEEGAFTFVFRQVSGQWLIKSQVWVARKGL